MSTAAQLEKRIREEYLDDVDEPYKFRSTSIISALNRAEREMCKKLPLLKDSTTSEICSVAISKVTGVYPRSFALDSRIIRIERLKYPGVTLPLKRTTTLVLDQQEPGWDEQEGIPTRFVQDQGVTTLTFNRQPIADGTVSLLVWRLPLNTLTSRTSPEVKQYDDELIHGALKYIYLVNDGEMFDAGASARWSQQFKDDIEAIRQELAANNPQEYVMRPEAF